MIQASEVLQTIAQPSPFFLNKGRVSEGRKFRHINHPEIYNHIEFLVRAACALPVEGSLLTGGGTEAYT